MGRIAPIPTAARRPACALTKSLMPSSRSRTRLRPPKAPGQQAGPTLERAIRDFCNQKLAAYKWIRQVKFVDTLPKTISGKIRKHTLRSPEANANQAGGMEHG